MPPRDAVLPDFGAPPVVETVVGYSFSPIPQWDLRHFGLFWNEVSKQYPTFQVQPPIADAADITSRVGLANLIVRAVGVTELPVRCWYVDASDARLLQLQRNRFLHNWRKVSGQETYPRYDDEIRPRFLAEWKRYVAFLQEHGLSQPEVSGWEVTYVNHFEKGREWSTLADIGRILRLWNAQSFPPRLGVPDGLVLDLAFPIDQNSKLAISVRPAVHQRDGREVLVLNLTARGKVANSEQAVQGIDSGREAIVTAFVDLTTDQMHELWQRRA